MASTCLAIADFRSLVFVEESTSIMMRTAPMVIAESATLKAGQW